MIDTHLILSILAHKASLYLLSLLDKKAIEPQPSVTLDRIYQELGPPSHVLSDEKKSSQILLRKEAIPRIVTHFELPASAEADLYRALDQTEARLKEGER
jgi:hypothetical protein